MNDAIVMVETYPGFKGEDTPRLFTLKGQRLDIIDIVERWDTDQHCYFRIMASDTNRYVLRHHIDEALWELVMRER
ncbi:hypothetical protein W02_06730 [Nitrospira sp. KM1]|uniref:hypothetical protein n=1 Tax=Nitrospira sp. KM1 TaxID=1936990 RepID=UPI0013A76342|nr:hypothetical protein [Nitrospira sp. KM1]BCA53533.1 hypothetical protein W02_06730 [Nitrospira sp. KM1]